MLSAEYLSTIRDQGEQMLELARRDLERPVPQYPGWTVGDLVTHTASVHGRTISVCRDRPTERIPVAVRPEAIDLLDWFASTLEEMIATLEESDPDTVVWGFWSSPSIRLWERRMVIETGIHRWDAGQAFEEEGHLDETVAVSGLDEYDDMWLPRLGEMPSLKVTATDIGKSWVYGSGTPDTAVDGTASDLYLRLMSRPSPVTLPEEWAAVVDNLASAPKP